MTTTTKTGWKRYIRDTTGLTATILFLAVAVILELIIVYSSMSFGLVDANALVWNIGGFTVGISPLFHLLPLTVIIVLFASWIYLTRHEAYNPAKTQTVRPTRPLPPPRRYEKKSFRRLRRFINRINKGLDGIGKGISERLSNTRLSRYLNEHFWGKTAIKSAWIIVLTFFALVLVACIIIYPQLIPGAVRAFLDAGNAAILGFVAWTVSAAHAVGQALSPIGWLGDAIGNGLASIAPSFRNGIVSLTTPIVKPLVQLDLAGKYVLTQNVAAWSSALVSLYVGRRVHRRR